MREPNHPSISDYFLYGIYRVFEFALKLLPMQVACWIGSALGSLTYLLFKERRHIVTRNLRIAFGEEMNHDEIHSLTHQTFQYSVSNLIASFRTSSFSNKQLRSRVEILGEENIEAARAQGADDNGLIYLICHMGNWELMAQVHILLPNIGPPATLYRPLDNPLIDKLIQRRRGSEGTKLFSRHDGFFKPIAYIKKGGSLGILADQHAGTSGVAVPFFGKLTSMTNLPAIIHRRTGAPILPMSMTSTSLGNWRVTIHPAIKIPSDQKTNTQFITNLCAKAYETIMRSNPADVLWMHGYWKVGSKGPLKIDGLQKKKSGRQRSLATKPFRVIVYTGDVGDGSADATEIIAQLDRLKNYRPDIHLTVVGKFNIGSSTDHFIPIPPSGESPNELAETLRAYDATLPQPIDCCLDFTESGNGGPLFEQAGFSHIFTFFGKYQSRRTRDYFLKVDRPTIEAFITSLGIND